MHVYQMRSTNQAVVLATQKRMQICMEALKEVSKVWLVAKMVHTLFLSILGNKVLEERLQKAAGKRHKKIKLDHAPSRGEHADHEDNKRNYDEMSLDYSGAPAPQVSFERSRPQTPAATPSRELGLQNAAHSTLSPNMRQNDAFLTSGASRNNTRPPTPFNPSYSIPGTPPDIYLHTRNSPNISAALWENFQPQQLFPESSNMQIDHFGVHNPLQGNLDPALQMPGMQTPTMGAQHMSGMHQQAQRGNVGQQGGQGLPAGMTTNHWDQPQGMSPDDTWSNSSRGGPAVPMTLNTEDWFQFFGVQGGDLSAISQAAGMDGSG